VKLFVLIALLATYTMAQICAEGNDAGKKKKTPHATIVVRPGPPVKPTQPAKPVGNQKSDWGEKKQR
jgi:hypothetical protein